MAQYDLHLYQNVHATGIEFTERTVLLNKGALLSANASAVPTVLAGGTDGYMLVRDDAETTGLKWVAIAAGHTQNTDTGTTSDIFAIDSDTFNLKIKAKSADGFEFLKADAVTKADASFGQCSMVTGTISTAPSSGNDIVNKTYVDGLLASTDAMIFKGTIGTGGTHTIAAFNALTTYNAGWTYRVIEAGTIRGKVCEIGDLVMVIVDRTGSGNADADFTVSQTNLDGAVIGPSSTTDGYLVLFNGSTGKLIKAGTGAPGSMVYANTTDYIAKALFDANTVLAANTDNTPAALTVAEQTLLGRKTGGNIAALTPAEIMNVIYVTAPATKTSSGKAGEIAKDDNYFYVCTALNTWKRSILATNW